MVSFQCEGCGDVLTKKKLDAHRGQCRTASYSCLDCMTHFHGTDYRAHTSCISEDQKYQGHLYKEKPAKQTKKSVKISETTESNTSKPRKAYVEDAPDADAGGNTVAIIEAPPEAPPPPPAAPSPAQPPVNVFDFLVPSDTPTASPKIPLPLPETAKPKKAVKMDYTPSLVGSEISSKHDKQITLKHDPDYDTRGFSYGADPIPTTQKRERPKVEYFTPAPRDLARDLEHHLVGNGTERKENHVSKSTDKKRKRHNNVEEFDLARRPSREASEDAIMSDAPPAQVQTPNFHTGLTGGLTRLLSKDSYSDEERDRYKATPAPSRPRPSQTYIVKESRGRAKPRNPSSSTAIVKVKKRRESDESRPRKHHRSHRSEYRDEKGGGGGGGSTAVTTTAVSTTHRKRKHRSPSKSRKIRQIEYYKDGDEGDTEQQMVVYKERAELFMSFVTKGPESEQGCSMNKALKRYHRERGERGLEKEVEEKELWKGLRLKRNERGEVVVFF